MRSAKFTTVALIAVLALGACADDDEVYYVDETALGGTYVPVTPLNYQVGSGYSGMVGDRRLRQLEREHLRPAQTAGTRAGYSTPTGPRAGVAIPAPSEQPPAPPLSATQPAVAPPPNPPLQSEGIEAPVSAPPAGVAPAAVGGATPPAPVPAPGPGNTLVTEPNAGEPAPAPQPLQAPNPLEARPDNQPEN